MVYTFEVPVTIEAIQLTQDISMYADAGDWLLIGSDGSQKVLNEEEFKKFCIKYREMK